jgi:hypothetical protein
LINDLSDGVLLEANAPPVQVSYGHLLDAVADIRQTVVLCGGLGTSPFMRQKVKDKVAILLAGYAQTVFPEKSWPAVSIGAAMAGIGKSPILLRKSQCHIGIAVHEKVDKSKHNKTDISARYGLGRRAWNQMKYLLTRVHSQRPTVLKIANDT